VTLPARALAALAALAAAAPAAAQTMLDQEERLIQIHSLLLDLPPAQAPGALLEGQLGVGLELVGIPYIDGTTGGKVQITASDRARIFPRPRLSLGLPAPDGFRAFVGLAYIPPIPINGVAVHYGALEGGMAWTPGPFALGERPGQHERQVAGEQHDQDAEDQQQGGDDATAGSAAGSFAGSHGPGS
jgi:hypothetical protein